MSGGGETAFPHRPGFKYEKVVVCEVREKRKAQTC